MKTSASHIIGGVLTYETTGLGSSSNSRNYIFTLKIYRDCSNISNIDFEPIANISIYKKALIGYSLVEDNPVRIQGRRKIDPTLKDCAILPPNVCVEEAIYQLEVLDLPIIRDNYYVIYQSCCRNATISNIPAPSEKGASFKIEITPEAQRNGNNSPSFSSFPPAVVCVNERFDFDYSAKDKDGDVLEYEFCSPLDTRSRSGGIFTRACGNADGEPACPPPYPEIPFTFPYNFADPMGGNPTIGIDSKTGKISGIPQLQGQFVIAVCVTEKRNGVILSKITRDYQFNVTNCDPLVRADVKEDSLINAKSYFVKSCGNKDITIINESTKAEYISSYHWEFNINGEKKVFTTKDIQVNFPDFGTYNGFLLLNKEKLCRDSATVVVKISNGAAPDFSMLYDSCSLGELKLLGKNKNGNASDVLEWNWKVGGNILLSNQTASTKLEKEGIYPIKLNILDKYGCKNAIEKNLRYFPDNAILSKKPSTFKGCVPLAVEFKNFYSLVPNAKIEWNFGFGEKQSILNPKVIYPNAGNYTAIAKITSPKGCVSIDTFKNVVTVVALPKANFSFSPDKPNSIQNTVTFKNLSQNATTYNWLSNQIPFSIAEHPIQTFKDTGAFQITLIAQNEIGCLDSLSKSFIIDTEVSYFLPNAFTPNADGTNDEFRGTGVLFNVRDFQMTIWNRWGEVIFFTKNPDEGWNGKKNNSGDKVPEGVYPYFVTFKDGKGKVKNYKGYATVVR